jgi:hypothetical protein
MAQAPTPSDPNDHPLGSSQSPATLRRGSPFAGPHTPVPQHAPSPPATHSSHAAIAEAPRDTGGAGDRGNRLPEPDVPPNVLAGSVNGSVEGPPIDGDSHPSVERRDPGNPFREGTATQQAVWTPSHSIFTEVCIGGVVSALTILPIALLSLFFFPMGVYWISSLGLVMGMLGTFSRRQRWAIFCMAAHAILLAANQLRFLWS